MNAHLVHLITPTPYLTLEEWAILLPSNSTTSTLYSASDYLLFSHTYQPWK